VNCYEDPKRNNPYDPYNWKYEIPDYNSDGLENILSDKLTHFTTNTYYSLNATARGNYSIQVIIRNSVLAGFDINWNSLKGWHPPVTYNDPDSGKIWTIFFSYTEGSNDCEIIFTTPASDVSIETNVYDNDSVIMTGTKIIMWN
jgi:hypothetical protein